MSGVSSSLPTPPVPRRPSLATSLSARSSVGRRISTLSVVEQGHAEDVNPEDHVVAEEIDEIKRYEDFTTIDWVRDAAREQQRRKAQKYFDGDTTGRGGSIWRRKISQSYDAGQAWIVVSLVGIAIGLIAACLNIITEWLSDIKLGYCTTAFYLNESFCCWGAEDGQYMEPSAKRCPKADCRRRLRRMASMEFAYPYKLLFIHYILGMLSSHNAQFQPPLIYRRLLLPLLPPDLSSLLLHMLLVLAFPRSSVSLQASS